MLANLSFLTVDVGTMTWTNREIAGMMQGRNIGIAFIDESK